MISRQQKGHGAGSGAMARKTLGRAAGRVWDYSTA